MCQCYKLRNWIINNAASYFFVIIWGNLNIGVFYMTYSHYKHSPEYFYLHEMLGVGLCLARATSSVINLNLAMLLLPMCRSLTTLLRYLFGHKVPTRTMRSLIDNCKNFHILCAWTVVLASGGHIIGHMMNAKNYSEYYDTRFVAINAASYEKEAPLLIILKSVPGVTGLILLAILSLILSSSFHIIRTSCYDLFWYTHKLYIVFYILVLFHAIRGVLKKQTNTETHVPGCIYLKHSNYSTEDHAMPFPESEPLTLDMDAKCNEPPQFKTIGSWTWIWVLLPLVLYISDTLYRIFCKQIRQTQVVSFHQCCRSVFEIQLKKENFSCRPGQYVLLQSPQISSFEWHPFTATNISTNVFALYIKNSGDWSEQLEQLLQEKQPGEVSPMYIDGPFSSPMEDVLKYKISICIAGGIGITPFISVLNYIGNNDLYNIVPQRLYLVWMSRSLDLFMLFGSKLHDIHKKLWELNKPDFLNIQLYLTFGENNLKANEQEYFLTKPLGSFLQNRLSFGRPKFKSVIQNILQHKEGSVGLFCCGPQGLHKTVQRECFDVDSATKIHFYHESF